MSDSGQKIEFPELNVSEEDVADGFYYQQLSEQEKQVYREILQGVRSMDETILLHAGENDEAGKIYEYLMYDRSELFWCDGSSKMTVSKIIQSFIRLISAHRIRENPDGSRLKMRHKRYLQVRRDVRQSMRRSSTFSNIL